MKYQTSMAFSYLTNPIQKASELTTTNKKQQYWSISISSNSSISSSHSSNRSSSISSKNSSSSRCCCLTSGQICLKTFLTRRTQLRCRNRSTRCFAAFAFFYFSISLKTRVSFDGNLAANSSISTYRIGSKTLLMEIDQCVAEYHQ